MSGALAPRAAAEPSAVAPAPMTRALTEEAGDCSGDGVVPAASAARLDARARGDGRRCATGLPRNGRSGRSLPLGPDRDTTIWGLLSLLGRGPASRILVAHPEEYLSVRVPSATNQM